MLEICAKTLCEAPSDIALVLQKFIAFVAKLYSNCEKISQQFLFKKKKIVLKFVVIVYLVIYRRIFNHFSLPKVRQYFYI